MKYSIFIIVLGFYTIVFSQSENHIILGNSRHYGDSIVLRWNGNTANNFLHIYHSKIIVQRKTAEEKNYTTIAEQNAVPLENWDKYLDITNQQTITAAAGLQNLLKTENTIYNTLQEQIEASETNRYLWQLTALAADINITVASALNLRFIDKNIDKNKLYNYKVFAINNNKTIKSDTLFFNIGNVLYKALDLSIPTFRESEKKVEITCPSNSQFSAYYIQKQANEKLDFITLNQSPLLGLAKNKGESAIIYLDTLLQNYIPAHYRMYAIDMFGNSSNYTKPITAMGRDRTPPTFATGLKIIENSNKTLTIQWDKINNLNGELGTSLALTHFNELPYLKLNEKLLPLSTNSYTIDINPKYDDYFFELQVYDTAGNYSIAKAYYLLTDSTGPQKPTNLKAIVDKKGIVKLTWKLNTEKDLDGYLIYFSNSKNTEFSGIVNKPLFDTLFYDTLSLKMLNKNVYYRIQAVDKRFNKSPISEIVKVQRPDTLKPVAPFISKYFISDTAIAIKWIPSGSVDVETHLLIKKNGFNLK